MVDLLADRAPLSPLQPDRPNRKRRVSREGVIDLVGAAVAALAAVWLVLSLAGVKFGFGYRLLLGRRELCTVRRPRVATHGILLMKERLATVSIWTGGVIALVALLGGRGLRGVEGFSGGVPQLSPVPGQRHHGGQIGRRFRGGPGHCRHPGAGRDRRLDLNPDRLPDRDLPGRIPQRALRASSRTSWTP